MLGHTARVWAASIATLDLGMHDNCMSHLGRPNVDSPCYWKPQGTANILPRWFGHKVWFGNHVCHQKCKGRRTGCLMILQWSEKHAPSQQNVCAHASLSAVKPCPNHTGKTREMILQETQGCIKSPLEESKEGLTAALLTQASKHVCSNPQSSAPHTNNSVKMALHA